MTCHRSHREPERVRNCSRSQTRTCPYRAWHPFVPRATNPPSILPRGARKATACSAELRARAGPLQPPLPAVAQAALCLWRLTARSSAIQTWQTAPSLHHLPQMSVVPWCQTHVVPPLLSCVTLTSSAEHLSKLDVVPLSQSCGRIK